MSPPFLKLLSVQMRSVLEGIITADKQSYGKVMFSQVGAHEEGGSYPLLPSCRVGMSKWDWVGVGTHLPGMGMTGGGYSYLPRWVCPGRVGTQPPPRYMGHGML